MNDIKVKESVIRDEKELKSIIKFAIAYSPKEDSFEMKIYEKSFCVTDLELVSYYLDGEALERMKLNNALDVFSLYYRDVFLNKKPQ